MLATEIFSSDYLTVECLAVAERDLVEEPVDLVVAGAGFDFEDFSLDLCGAV